MLKRERQKFTKKDAQTIVEYSIMIGLVVLIMFAMNPMIKRVTQTMIRTVSDQIGSQQNAEQLFNAGGFTMGTNIATSAIQDKTIREFLGTTNYIYSDAVFTGQSVLSNLGFQEDQ